MTDDVTRRTVPGLARAREARDMTQGCLAEAAGVSEKTVRRAEAGQPVAPETRMALKAVLGEALTDPGAPGGIHSGPACAAADRERVEVMPEQIPSHGSMPPRMPGSARGAAALALGACIALVCVGTGMWWRRDADLPPGYTREPKMGLAMRVVAFDKGVPLPEGLPVDRSIEQVGAKHASEIIEAVTRAGGWVGPVNDLRTSPRRALLLGLDTEAPYLQSVTPGPCAAKDEVNFHDGNCGHLGVVRFGTTLTASKVDGGLLLDLDWQDVTKGIDVFDEVRPGPPTLAKSGTEAFMANGSGNVAITRMGRNLIFVDALPSRPPPNTEMAGAVP